MVSGSAASAAADVIGQTLTLDGEAYTIVGVMPARFSIASWGASGRDFWVPLAYTDAERAVRENHNAQVVARLKPDVHARAGASRDGCDLDAARAASIRRRTPAGARR